MDKDKKRIDFDSIIESVKKDLDTIKENVETILEEESLEDELNELKRRIANLAEDMYVDIDENNDEIDWEDFFHLVDDTLETEHLKLNFKKFSKFNRLTNEEVLVAASIGLLASIIDIFFVGTPDMVKLYRGPEVFDGSILTGKLREISMAKLDILQNIYKFTEKKFKVPYDTSQLSDVVTPDNHRLRSIGHDPMFGLLFAVADIVLGTATLIDNEGKIRITIGKSKVPNNEKWLAVIYYFGHLISDIYTARGLPIPGFFMTQFFTAGSGDKKVSEIAFDMYKNGYDLRHMASMKAPVFIKDQLIKLYITLTEQSDNDMATMAQTQLNEQDYKIKYHLLSLVADTVGVVGNIAKFISPPVALNPCALNAAQWYEFFKTGSVILLAYNRDTAVEEAIYNRKQIGEAWDLLLKEE